eukprot:9272760-Prorocentrum_lima.AAC.1
MGSYGDRLNPAPGDPGIQAGNQQQQRVEIPTHGGHDPRAHDQGPHEHQPGESMESEGIQAPPG